MSGWLCGGKNAGCGGGGSVAPPFNGGGGSVLPPFNGGGGGSVVPPFNGEGGVPRWRGAEESPFALLEEAAAEVVGRRACAAAADALDAAEAAEARR